MLLTEAQSARLVGAVATGLGVVTVFAPEKVARPFGATIATSQDRYLGRQIGLDLTALGTVTLLSTDEHRHRVLQIATTTAAALTGITLAARIKSDIPSRYAVPMTAASLLIGGAAALPMVGRRSDNRTRTGSDR